VLLKTLMKHYKTNKIIISLSGFDPSGGAGLVSDIKTLSSFNVHCFSIPTSLTVQDYNMFYKTYDVDTNYIFETLNLLISQYKIDAIKIGLFNNIDFLNKLNIFLSNHKINTILLDPVITSSSGFKIWDDNILNIVVDKLLYLIDIITPNLNEFNILYTKVFKEPYISLKEAIVKLQRKYSFKITVTSGDSDSNTILNYYYDGLCFKEHSIEKKIFSKNIHGTGCAFATSLLGFYINNNDFIKSSSNASNFVYEAISKHELLNNSIVLNYRGVYELNS